MTLGELIGQFRIDVQDRVEPYLWDGDEVKFWFNEAEEEAAIRKQLLRESADPAICQIQIRRGVRSYPLNPLAFEIVYASYVPAGATGSIPWPLGLTSAAEMDRVSPAWRTIPNRPSALIAYDNTVEPNCNPNADYTVNMEVYRLPMEPMDDEDDCPEINAVHHRRLIDWAKFRAYDKQDADTFDANKSQASLDRFEAYFGPRPDAAGRKKLNASVPHRNQVA